MPSDTLLVVKPSRWLSIALLFSLVFLPLAEGATGKKGTAKKSSGKPAASASATSGKKSKGRTYTARSKRFKRGKSARFVPKQAAPTPERVQDIQRALTQRGIPVEVTGTMTPATLDAIKTFQQQQKLNVTGKLDALTLIGLGLGPKRDENPAARAGQNPAAELPSQERNQ